MKITALIKNIGAKAMRPMRLLTIWARQNLQLLSSPSLAEELSFR